MTDFLEILLCPLCAGPLFRADGCLRCADGHSYDPARAGYVNLLPPGRKNNAKTGDEREMIRARSEFLRRGFYDPIDEALSADLSSVLPQTDADAPLRVCDMGAGEGYHTCKSAALLAEKKSAAEKNTEILSLSASLDDIRRRIGELEEDRARHEGIFDALEKITLKRRIDAADEAESQLSKLKSAMQALAASPFSEGTEALLGDSEREIRAYDEQRAAYLERFPAEGGIPAEPRPSPFRAQEYEEDEEEEDDGIIPKDGPLPADILSRAKPEDRFDPYEDSDALKMDTLNSVVGDNIPDPLAAIAGVRQLASRSRGEFAAALGLAAASVIGLGVSLALAVNGHPVYPLPLVLSLLLMTGAVVAVIRHVGTSAALTESLQEWNAESADEIEFAVRERLHVLERESASGGERRRMLDSLEAA